LYYYLFQETSNRSLSDFSLEIAKPQQNTLSALIQRLLPKLAQQASKNSPLHEHVFMTFMADKLSVKIPKILRLLFAKSEKPTISEDSHREIKAELPSLLSLNENESKNEDESNLYDSNPSMILNRPYFFLSLLLSIVVAVVAVIGIVAFGKEEYSYVTLFLSSIAIIIGNIGLLVLIIWWIKVINMRLIVTTESVTLISGILSKNTREVFLSDIKSVQIKQSFFQRDIGAGYLKVVSATSSNAEIAIAGIPSVYKVKQIIDKHRRDQRA
jgi:hypothetical protein